MKIILDEDKLLEIMRKNGVKSYVELCRESGVNLGSFHSRRQHRTLSKESFWLLADYLNCHVEEIQIADWEV
ncbi:MAG: hypothetical protein NC177_14305 [Ruminococcus flavefaciens]|nr:hypothetical protein [Ruminococcus flavefaciens]